MYFKKREKFKSESKKEKKKKKKKKEKEKEMQEALFNDYADNIFLHEDL